MKKTYSPSTGFQIVAVFLLAICLQACGKPTFEDAFMEGCEDSEMPTDLCTCTINKLKAHYGEEALQYMHESGRPAQDLPQASMAFTQQCINALSPP